MQRRTFIALTLGITVIALILVYLQRVEKPKDSGLDRLPQGPSENVDPSASLVGTTADGAADPAVRQEAEDLGATPSRNVADLDPDRIFVGRFALTDGDGLVETRLNGSVVPVPGRMAHGIGIKCEVKDGRFSFPFPDGKSSLRFKDLVLGGGQATCDAQLSFGEWIPGKEHLLQATRVPTITFSVTDKDTDVHLSKVEVSSARSMLPPGRLFPDDLKGGRGGRFSDPIALGMASPFTLPARKFGARSEMVEAHIHQPGYTHAFIHFNPQTPETQEVQLERAGKIAWRVSGPIAPKLKLRIYQPSKGTKNPLGEWNITKDRSRDILTGVPPGTYKLRIEQGFWHSNPAQCGEVEVSVTAGVTSQANLPIVMPRGSSTQTAKLSGTVYIPGGWEFDANDIRILQIDDKGNLKDVGHRQTLKPTDETGLYKFDAGELPVGEYSVDHMGAGHQWHIALGSAGNENAHLVMPQPADVTVKLLQGNSQPMDGTSRVSWVMVHPHRKNAYAPSQSAKYNAELKCFEFCAPQGLIKITPHSEHFLADPIQSSIRRGANEVIIPVKLPFELRLDCRSNGKSIPFRTGMVTRTSPSGANQRRASRYSRKRPGPPALYWFRHAGPHQISIRPIEGFEDVPPFEITLTSGTVTKHVIHLERISNPK